MASMAYVVPEPKNVEADLLEKASKLHLDAFSCWKETLHHYSTKLEILTYERDSLLIQLKKANAEKIQLQKQFRDNLKTQIRRNNSLQDMITSLTHGSNELGSPITQGENDETDPSITFQGSETSHAASMNSEEDNHSRGRDIICIAMEAEEENTRDDATFSDYSETRSHHSLQRNDDLEISHARDNVIVTPSDMIDIEEAEGHSSTRTTATSNGQTGGHKLIPTVLNIHEHRAVSNSWPHCMERRLSKSESDTMICSAPSIKEEVDTTEESATTKKFTLELTQHPSNGKQDNLSRGELDGPRGNARIRTMTDSDSVVQGDSHERPDKNCCFCGECGRWFDNSYKLRKHLAFHSDERPFKCGVCNKRFRLKHHLVEHTRVHTGYRPYRCTRCGKGFNRRGIAEMHICSGNDTSSSELIRESGKGDENDD